MKNEAPITCQIQVPFRFDVYFTRKVFHPENNLLREVLKHRVSEKLLVVVEESLITSMPSLLGDIRKYFSQQQAGLELVDDPVVLAGGEALKNSFAAVEKLHGSSTAMVSHGIPIYCHRGRRFAGCRWTCRGHSASRNSACAPSNHHA